TARHEARMAQTLRQFEDRLCSALGLRDRDMALEAFEVVTGALMRRLMPREAHDFAAQLPARVRERLMEEPPGPDRSVTRTAIEDELARRLSLSIEEASRLVERIGATLGEFVSQGELEQVRDQLPGSLKPLIGHAPSMA